MSVVRLTEALMGPQTLTISPAMSSVSSNELKVEAGHLKKKKAMRTAVILFDLRFGTMYELV